MFLKAFTALLLVEIATAKHFQYPAGDEPCVMADLATNMLLSFTNPSGTTKKIPQFSLDNTTVIKGNCDTPSMTMQWAKDSATLTMMFVSQPNNTVQMDITFTVLPNTVFGNGDNSNIALEQKAIVGDTKTSYKCVSLQSIVFPAKQVTSSNNTYNLVMNISNAQLQAFDLNSTTYNPEVTECSQDGPTTEGPTTAPHTGTTETKPPTTQEPTTEPPHNGTTHTNPPTPTTEPTTHTGTEPPTTEPTTHTGTEPPTTKPHTTVQTTISPTTEAPTDHPRQNFTVKGENGTICILMVGEFLFTLPYPAGNETKTKTATFGVHPPTKVTGHCGKNESELLNVTFNEDWELIIVVTEGKNSQDLQASDKSFWWKQLNLTYTYTAEMFPGVNASLVNSSNTISKDLPKDYFKAGLDQSYLCNSDLTTDLGGGAKLNTWDLQYKAFKTENKTTFDPDGDKMMECSQDSKTNSVVPIAVGAALAGLVVIVLIAYLIGRRRNRKGYQSV